MLLATDYPFLNILWTMIIFFAWVIFIWVAITVYVLVAIVRKRLGLEASLYEILQILSVTLFEKTPILQAFQRSSSPPILPSAPNQLILFDF